MAQGIAVPQLTRVGSTPDQATQARSIEQALADTSAALQQITELDEENLAELIEGLTVDTTPDDTDLIPVANGDGTLSAVEVGDLARDPQPIFPLTPPVGRWTRLNGRQSGEAVSGATISLGSGAARLYPFMVSRPIASGTITVLRTGGAAVSADTLMAIYDTDSATGLPNARLFSGTGAAVLAFTDLVPGVLYWAALGQLSTAITWAALTVAESKAPFGLDGAEHATTAECNSFAITVASALPSPFSGAVTYTAATIPTFYLEDPS